ncbi:serine threonine-protein kinase-like domain-containing protein [Ceraceosorus bombacis]|uniref:Serine threonine-protein kinase-like domain-containing protein n=1 Tax=Ceraceosorus bombacis TaxID=401625 RepID=A0A0P1BAP0_9BASI|nr:serine threonine-protein kinase-like domain-containing protein [Ceraceosorus bombacis]
MSSSSCVDIRAFPSAAGMDDDDPSRRPEAGGREAATASAQQPGSSSAQTRSDLHHTHSTSSLSSLGRRHSLTSPSDSNPSFAAQQRRPSGSQPRSPNLPSPRASTQDASRASTSRASPARPFANMRTSTMFETRDAESFNRDRNPLEWTVPPSHSTGSRGLSAVPRAATIFLGKDHERWKQHARDSLDGETMGTHLAWKRGTASLVGVTRSSISALGLGEDEPSDDLYNSHDDETFSASGSSGPPTRRGSRSRSTNSRSGSWGQSVPQSLDAAAKAAIAQGNGASKVDQLHQRGSTEGSSMSSSMVASPTSPSMITTSKFSLPRSRRFSSNGPEAAFLRHETVIGIHTPRRGSASSGSAGSSGKNTPNKGSVGERVALAPLSQIKTPTNGKPSILTFADDEAAKGRETSRKPKKKPLHKRPRTPSPRSGQFRSRASLQLARRRRPIRVDGTLYDRGGPFREGAVTDGLSVRLFSSADGAEPGYIDEDGHMTSVDESSAICDEDAEPTTYLITTPDNRVSSAAKLRRWAMDGEGRFWAAMELMSVERKMRNADGGIGGVSRAIIRGLRDRYVEDLLDEVQKAETLNPTRTGVVAKVLRTSDDKYIRLEEDYPEEAFFVIAGCDESELFPVVSLVFCGALRAISAFHAAGWLHGDIKLENLMFDEQARLVVIDYENANPFRGVPGGDGRVALVSYDWIPPEAFPGPQGRRVGPSADLWALGANLVRAFALRDGVDDIEVREALLGKGQSAFLNFRRKYLLKRQGAGSDPSSTSTTNAPPSPNAQTSGGDHLHATVNSISVPRITTSDEHLSTDGSRHEGSQHHHSSEFSKSSPGSSPSRRQPPRASDIDLTAILEGESVDYSAASPGSTSSNATKPLSPPAPSAGPSPVRLLRAFATQAPGMCQFVLARCLSELPEERGADAEAEGLEMVRELERQRDEIGDRSILATGERAVRTAIDLSGSAWVKPKLEAARQSLGLGE